MRYPKRSENREQATRDSIVFADGAVPGSADAILFVVDRTHAEAGATGIIWLDAIRLEL